MKEILIRLEDAQYETLRKLAFDSRISMAEHIRRALKDYLKKNGFPGGYAVVAVTEEIRRLDDFPVKDETYCVGQVTDGRFFFSWGPEWPREEELDDGRIHFVVPASDVEDGESGIEYFDTEEKALEAFEAAIEAASE